jgi:hypothetical protein
MHARMLQHFKIVVIDVKSKKIYQESCLKKKQLAQIQEIVTMDDVKGFNWI